MNAGGKSEFGKPGGCLTKARKRGPMRGSRGVSASPNEGGNGGKRKDDTN